MSKWLAETELLQNIVRGLLEPRQEHYSEESIKYKIIEYPSLCQRHLSTKNKYGQSLYGVLVDRRHQKSQYCIVFMHGLASNILQGAALIDHLLPNTALFSFDFAGSGKSEGSCNTYGLKEAEDIEAVLRLLQGEGYGQFVLWGRSMGAVACLLHSFSQESEHVVAQVVDSPFSSFEAVCALYAKKFIGIPDVLVAPAVSVLKESFSTHRFNPFRIDLLPLAHRSTLPTLFVYNEHDEVIPASNCEGIIKQLGEECYYERILIEDEHNHVRSAHSLAAVFRTLQKLLKTYEKNKSRANKRKGFDVFSSFVKKNSAKHLQVTDSQKEEGEKGKKREFRRSAIYCSLSKKNSCFLSPKAPKKSEVNPEFLFFNTNW